MRVKLVFTCSLLAAILGAGSSIAIVLWRFTSLRPLSEPGLLVLSTYLLPVLATLSASIFVYRHTARRRRLQAALTAIIALLFTILFFIVATIYFRATVRDQHQTNAIGLSLTSPRETGRG